jgi:hypothetical protein
VPANSTIRSAGRPRGGADRRHAGAPELIGGPLGQSTGGLARELDIPGVRGHNLVVESGGHPSAPWHRCLGDGHDGDREAVQDRPGLEGASGAFGSG